MIEKIKENVMKELNIDNKDRWAFVIDRTLVEVEKEIKRCIKYNEKDKKEGAGWAGSININDILNEQLEGLLKARGGEDD